MFVLLFILLAAIYVLQGFWERLQVLSKGSEFEQFKKSIYRGICFPSVLWALANFGFPGFPPFDPELAISYWYHLPWVGRWLTICIDGIVLIASFWTGLWYIRLFARMVALSTDRREVLLPATLLSLALLPIGGFFIYKFGFRTWGFASILWMLPVVHAILPHSEWNKEKPMYSSALARINFGKYAEAEQHVIHELEKSENDFEGWMLLAELYARHFRSLKDATQVVHDVCEQENIQAVQISVACHRLADWHLQFGEDPAAARMALDLICLKLPGSLFARDAETRMKNLPRTREELRESKTARPIKLPSLSEDLDSEKSPHSARDSSDPVEEMNRLVQRLEADPNNTAAREQLAAVYAEKLEKPALGIEQLELLMQLPDAEEKDKAKWLSQIASWELRLRKNKDRFRELLKQIIREYPSSVQAFAAQRRLNLLEMEEIDAGDSPPAPALKVKT